MKVTIPVSLGELYDKISILAIKEQFIDDENKLENIKNELRQLEEIASQYPIDTDLYEQLEQVNTALWNIEDKIREQERLEQYDDIFINLARSVYITNDERSNIKKEINLKYGSEIIEEKSYNEYK